MGLQTEDVRISAGLEYSRITAGLSDIRSNVYKLADDVPKKLGSVFKGQLYGLVSQGLEKATELLTDWWINAVYGQSDAISRARMRASNDMADLADNARKMKKAADDRYASSRSKADFDRMIDDDKMKALQFEEEALRRNIDLQNKAAKFAREARYGLDPKDPKNRGTIDLLAIDEQKAKTSVSDLRSQLLENDLKQTDLRSRMLKQTGSDIRDRQKAVDAANKHAADNLEGIQDKATGQNSAQGNQQYDPSRPIPVKIVDVKL